MFYLQAGIHVILDMIICVFATSRRVSLITSIFWKVGPWADPAVTCLFWKQKH